MTEYINKAPTATIFDGLVKAKSVLASHHNILVSVSGGADSDCMIDIVKYGIEILKRRAKVTVPAAIAKVGYPFFSKEFSDRISRFQHHDFNWDKGTIEELADK